MCIELYVLSLRDNTINVVYSDIYSSILSRIACFVLQCIEGLSQCTNLTSLFLYTNNISTIEGLGALTKLEKLWLNANAISAIEVRPSVRL